MAVNQQGGTSSHELKSDCSSSGDLRLATHSNCNGTKFITWLHKSTCYDLHIDKNDNHDFT